MSCPTLSVIRVTFPENFDSHRRVCLGGSLTRWCCNHSGRVLSSPDNSFFITDLDAQKVSGLLHILECSDCVYSMALATPSFFDSLFSGEGVA